MEGMYGLLVSAASADFISTRVCKFEISEKKIQLIDIGSWAVRGVGMTVGPSSILVMTSEGKYRVLKA